MAGNGSNTVRGLGGADDLTGGSGRDKFVYKTEDVIGADASHLGVDTIHGFQTNDTLDLRGMLQGVATFDAAGNSLLDDHVHIVDVVGGVMVQVKVGDTFVDVAKLEGVVGGGVQASNWAADGLIMIDAVYEVGGSDPLLFV
jgi:Ca2+-binding RTX toxin-like protein